MNKIIFIGFIVISTLVLTLSTVQAQINTSYQYGLLKVSIHSKYLEPKLNDYLNKNATGYVVNTRSKTAYIKNFHSSFHDGSIVIRFDYDSRMRNLTTMPPWLGGNRIYGSWLKNTGWIEVDAKVQLDNWTLYAYTNHEDVRWKGGDWFTNEIHGNLFDELIKKELIYKVNIGITYAMDGKNIDLKEFIIQYGAPEIARYLEQPTYEVIRRMENDIKRAKINIFLDKDGLNTQIMLKYSK